MTKTLMSSPPVVVVTTGFLFVVASLVLPDQINLSSSNVAPFLNLICFLINVMAVSIPGRWDYSNSSSSHPWQQQLATIQPEQQLRPMTMTTMTEQGQETNSTTLDRTTTTTTTTTTTMRDDEIILPDKNGGSGGSGDWLTETTPLMMTTTTTTKLASSKLTNDNEQEQQRRLLLQETLDATMDDDLAILRTRTLLLPSGWAFSIWGLIYCGEAMFCIAPWLVGMILMVPPFFVTTTTTTTTTTTILTGVLPTTLLVPQITIPFCAANLLQSLWCVSFRPSFNQGWYKYVSVAMLGGTAVALHQVAVVAVPTTAATTTIIVSSLLSSSSSSSNGDTDSATMAPDLIVVQLLLVPLLVHFGWTTAATLVNLNGSIAMEIDVSDAMIAAVGHASSVVATLLGVSVTVFGRNPVYGCTISWALAACAQGINSRVADVTAEHSQVGGVASSSGSGSSNCGGGSSSSSSSSRSTWRGNGGGRSGGGNGVERREGRGERPIRINEEDARLRLIQGESDVLLMAGHVQGILCWAGCGLCLAASICSLFLPE
jgi:hypothetical protein